MEPANKPHAPALTLKEFFSETYSVPAYQRSFAWGIEECQQLFLDLQDFADSDDHYYFMGQVIVSASTATERYDLVDGQQRATALLILLAAIREKFEMHPDKDSDQALKVWLSELNLLLVYSPGANQLSPRVRVAGDGPELLNAMISKKTLPKTESFTRENILGAYEEFTKLLDMHYPNVTKVPALYRKLADGVILVRLEIQSHEEAIGVFERINNRGLPLDSADLIKNTIFSKVNNADYELISELWNKGSDTLHSSKISRIRSMGYLLRAMLAIETGQKVTDKALRDKWGLRLENRSIAIEFAKSLPDRATHLTRIGDGMNPNDKTLKNLNDGTKHFRFIQHFPILLAGHHLNPATYEYLADLVEDRAILSIAASERPQDFEKIVPAWSSSIHKLGKSSKDEDVYEQTQDLLADVNTLIDRAEANFRSWRYTSSSERKRIRYVLARLSREIQLELKEPHVPPLIEYLRRPTVNGKKKPKGYDLDHIRPQGKYGDLDLTHCVGNLALVSESDQRAAGDAEPIEKEPIYRISSMILTQSLCADVKGPEKRIKVLKKVWDKSPPSLENWTDKAISSRTDMYWDLFKSSLLARLSPQN